MPEPKRPRSDREALDALREQVRATQEAAERIVRETGERVSGGTPPGGWDVPREPVGEATTELQALVTLFESLRDLLPEDLRQQVAELVRQLLLVMRALIDWLVERMDYRSPPATTPPVEDIPIA